MSTVILARFKNKQDATAAAKLIKKYKSDASLLDSDLWEDMELGKLIDDGMNEKGQVPLEAFLKTLRG